MFLIKPKINPIVRLHHLQGLLIKEELEIKIEICLRKAEEYAKKGHFGWMSYWYRKENDLEHKLKKLIK